MAISDKLTYLGETKSQLKTMLQYANSNITNDTTFRAYVSGLFQAYINILNNPENLFNTLPKITASGTNISLNNTIEAPMKIEYNPSELTQEGTPTPSSPQDIHTISGDNTIVVEGKNLFNKNTITSGRVISRNTGTTSTNNDYGATDYIPINENTTFTCTGFNVWYTACYDKNKAYLGYMENSNTMTTLTGTSYIRASLLLTNLNTAQIEYGSTATTYEPHQENTYPINLDFDYCKIGNYEDRIFRTSGKNLFDKNNANILNAYLSSADNKIIDNAVNRTLYINCEPNTTYTITKIASATFSVAYTKELPANNVVIYGYNTQASVVSNNYRKITITTGDGAKYLACRFMQTVQDTLTQEQLLATIQIEKGSTATPYEPYGTNEWYIKKNIGKVVLDGSESWELDTTKTITQVFNSNNAITNRLLSNINYFSNYFTTQDGDTEKIAFTTDQNRVYLAINKTTANSEAELRTWLSTHNTIVYYILATPTYTKITGELANQLEAVKYSMDSQTSISQVNDDLPFELSVSALEDLR